VIPAGFNVPEYELLAGTARTSAPAWASPLAERRVLLYLARVHEAKGIDDLITAWIELAPAHPDWDILIVGPGLADEVRPRQELIAARGLANRCHWTGIIPDVERTWAYLHADLYVLPSHKENFGNTVQEALGHGTATITTTQTPWLKLETWGCGWVCEDNASSLTETLAKALTRTSSELKTMGERGQRIIMNDYSLESVVSRQLALYEDLIKGRELSKL